jgi:hypothetical protein
MRQDAASRFREITDVRFDQMVVSHGLSAVSYNCPIENAKKILADSSLEISCSDYSETLGEIGLYIKGTTLCVGAEDLGSILVSGGKRDIYGIPDLITNFDEYAPAEFGYREHIKTNLEVVGVWVKNANNKAAEEIANLFNVSVSYIN